MIQKDDEHIVKAKDLKGNWVEGYLFSIRGKYFIFRNGYTCNNIHSLTFVINDWIEIDTFTICRKAGYKDFWEYDIVEFDEGEFEGKLTKQKGVIEFIQGAFCIYSLSAMRVLIPLHEILPDDRIYWKMKIGRKLVQYIEKDFRVIGNKFDNPKLYKEAVE